MIADLLFLGEEQLQFDVGGAAIAFPYYKQNSDCSLYFQCIKFGVPASKNKASTNIQSVLHFQYEEDYDNFTVWESKICSHYFLFWFFMALFLNSNRFGQGQLHKSTHDRIKYSYKHKNIFRVVQKFLCSTIQAWKCQTYNCLHVERGFSVFTNLAL